MRVSYKKKFLSFILLATTVAPTTLADKNNSDSEESNDSSIVITKEQSENLTIEREDFGFLDRVENLDIDYIQHQVDDSGIDKDVVKEHVVGFDNPEIYDAENAIDERRSIGQRGEISEGDLRNHHGLGMAGSPHPEAPAHGTFIKRKDPNAPGSAETAHEKLSPGETVIIQRNGYKYVRSNDGKTTSRYTPEGKKDDEYVDKKAKAEEERKKKEEERKKKEDKEVENTCVGATDPAACEEYERKKREEERKKAEEERKKKEKEEKEEKGEDCIREDNCEEEGVGPKYVAGGQNVEEASLEDEILDDGGVNCDDRNEGCEELGGVEAEMPGNLDDGNGCDERGDDSDCFGFGDAEPTEADFHRNDIGPMIGDLRGISDEGVGQAGVKAAINIGLGIENTEGTGGSGTEGQGRNGNEGLFGGVSIESEVNNLGVQNQEVPEDVEDGR